MNIQIEKNVMVPMRDGERLATDVYRPTDQGHFPVLMMRLSYGKEDVAIYANTFVEAGYPTRPVKPLGSPMGIQGAVLSGRDGMGYSTGVY